MPEKLKAVKNCHLCGLEAIDNCQTQNKHIPDDETLTPCVFCVRNPLTKLTKWRLDAYSQVWYREADKNPRIDDPDPHERSILTLLNLITNEVSEKLAEVGA